MKARSFSLKLFALAFSLSLIFSCTKENKSTPKRNSIFKTYVESYTTANVSVAGEIMLSFRSDVPFAQQGEKLPKGLYNISPKVEGTAYWKDLKTIVFKPDNWLKYDTKYTVSLHIRDFFEKETAENDLISFRFRTYKQAFSVAPKALVVQGSTYRIAATLSFADAAKKPDVEQMIKMLDPNLASRVKWEHIGLRDHTFYIDSVARHEDAYQVLFNVDGSAFNLTNSTEYKIEIPGLNNFKLLSTKVEQDPMQCLVLEFSDAINEHQNLNGLIEIYGDDEYKISVEQNTVKLIPSKRISGNRILRISENIKNFMSFSLGETVERIISFEALKPNIRFPKSGVYVPSSDKACVIPFQAVNLNAVDLYVIKIYENNIPYFLHNNKLDGSNQLSHYGRLVHREKIQLLENDAVNTGAWENYSIDLKELVETEPGAIYRVEFRMKKDYAIYPCANNDDENSIEVDEEDELFTDVFDHGNYWPQYEYSSEYKWSERDNPCHISYYLNKYISKNVIASNVGLMVKTNGQNQYRVFTTDLISAAPLSGVNVEFFNYQNQKVAEAITNKEGIADVALEQAPWLIVAENGNEKTYLRVDDGSALSYASFNIGGMEYEKGLKGFFYGERGVWRPGDTIHLTFVLNDIENKMPADQPAVLYLYNPENVLVKKVVNANPVDQFYKFTLKTEKSDPTGNWMVKLKMGGATFNKYLKVETIKPNRLKINIDFDQDILKSGQNVNGKFNVAWLHGAVGKNLKIKADVIYLSKTFKADNYPDFVFYDPVAKMDMRDETFFEGRTDDKGNATFSVHKNLGSLAPSMARAVFTIKAFEPGGEFSIIQKSEDFYPYEKYIGLRMPEKPKDFWCYETKRDYIVDVVSLNYEGKPVDAKNLDVKVYKLNWEWWWHSNNSDLAYYIKRNYNQQVFSQKISTKDGKGSFNLNIDDNDYGRYLVRVTDQNGHSTGQIVYFDWPWRKSNDAMGGATRLDLNVDKEEYQVGEKIKLKIPGNKGAKALVSIETGTKILQNFWVEIDSDNTEVEIQASKEMSPNAYLSVSLLQPYEQTLNENPLRMYGVIPVFVKNNESYLNPMVKAPDEIEPESEFDIEVSEQNGKEMTYTVAIVDEGLLDITNFKTPDIHAAFNHRRALMVKMWDMFDYVTGAFGGKIEKVFGIGGDGELMNKDKKDDNRFKPVVLYSGPHHLAAGEKQQLHFKMPNYIGSVKVMVVAGNEMAYGATDKAIPVRKPVMVLATLPRLVSPGEKVVLPVSSFIMDNDIREAKVSITTNDFFKTTESTQILTVEELGEYTCDFNLEVAEKIGRGQVQVLVETSKGDAEYAINIEVRNPNLPLKRTNNYVLNGGEHMDLSISALGMAGTNIMRFEASSMPPLNLSKRLNNLLRYPYGCIEQTTSKAFPQLYLSNLMELDNEQKNHVQFNITETLRKLIDFQTRSGGFSYWPGRSEFVSLWGTVYATHFILEAEKAGYQIPFSLKSNAIDYLKKSSNFKHSDYYKNYLQNINSYRLYVLALAGEPDLSGMNRLRQDDKISETVKWRLALAYSLVGKDDVATTLIDINKIEVADYEDMGETYGSRYRDYAMLMETLTQLGYKKEVAKILKEFSDALSNEDQYLSTQTTAWMLMSIANAKELVATSGKLNFAYQINADSKQEVESEELIILKNWEADQDSKVKIQNKSNDILFVTTHSEGYPLVDETGAIAKNLSLKVDYMDLKGKYINPDSIARGTDFKAVFSIKYTGIQRWGRLKNMALKQIFPSGWEIINSRLYGDGYKISGAKPDYMDIRDDRVYLFFDLSPSDEISFEVLLNAAYEGEYTMPATVVEAMYSDKYYAKTKGGKTVVMAD